MVDVEMGRGSLAKKFAIVSRRQLCSERKNPHKREMPS